MVNWKNDDPTGVVADGSPLNLEKILYEFDSPLIFVASDSLSDQLFYKLDDQRDGTSIFLATSTVPKVIEALEKGHLSLRGALSEGRHHRIVNLTDDMKVVKYWDCEFDELDDIYLPVPGTGISHECGDRAIGSRNTHITIC